jgi:hypothetical protein
VACARRRSQTLAQRRSSCAGCKGPARTTHRGVDLDALSEPQLERLHAGLVKLASMDEPVLASLVEQVLAGDELVSSE